MAVRLVVLTIGLLAGLSAEAQTLENKRPIVVIWAEGIESRRRQPLGSGFVLNAQGDVLTAKHVVQNAVEGQRPVVSISTKSEASVRVDMTDIDCATTRDFCMIRVPQDVIESQGISRFHRLGCYVLPIPSAQDAGKSYRRRLRDVQIWQRDPVVAAYRSGRRSCPRLFGVGPDSVSKPCADR